MSPTLETRTAAPPFVLVTGGKGGVGKTTVAANLAVALAEAHLSPVVADLDFGLANLDLVLGVQPERTVEDFLDGACELEECLHGERSGARLLAAGSGSYERTRHDPTRHVRLREALGRTDAGIVIGDSAAGIGDDVLEFGSSADRVLVVTTPDPAAVTDAYGVIKAMDAFALDAGREVPTPEVFVNLARDAKEARTVAEKLAGVCERFLARSPRFVGWMARSRTVTRGVLQQEPFVSADPSSAPARSLAALARRYAVLSPLGRALAAPKASVGHGR